jgi:hypothetical protein
MFRIHKEKANKQASKNGRITFISYHNRFLIVFTSFIIMIFLAITGYLMIRGESTALAEFIPYVIALFILFLIAFFVYIIRLPLSIVLDGDVLTVKKLLSSKSFNRTQISAFEIQTEDMPRSRSGPKWSHTLILRTYEHGSFTLATQPSHGQEAIEFKEAVRYLNKWRQLTSR